MEYKEPDWQYTPPVRGWFTRNVFWFVPSIMLIVAVPIVCCGGGVWMFWQAFAEPYNAALEFAKESPKVATRLGESIRGGRNINVANYKNENDIRRCSISFDIRGSRDKGRLEANMECKDGKWKPAKLKVIFADKSEIVVLKNAPPEALE